MRMTFKETILGQRQKAVLFVMITALLWSLGGMLIKLVSWNPIAIAGARSAIAALVILPFIKRPRMRWSGPMVGGAIAYAATVILFVSSNKLTTAANAILLQYTAPIYIAVFSAWFLKEKIHLADWVTVLCVIGGMILFFLDDLSGGDLLGNILAILSGISFAFMIMFMRKQKDNSPLESAFYGNVITVLISFPFMIGPVPDASSILGLLLLGVFQLGLAYIFYSAGIKHVTALEGVLIPVIEPLLNPVWVLLFVGEVPGKWSLIGGAVVLVSIVARGIISTIKAKDTMKDCSQELQAGGL